MVVTVVEFAVVYYALVTVVVSTVKPCSGPVLLGMILAVYGIWTGVDTGYILYMAEVFSVAGNRICNLDRKGVVHCSCIHSVSLGSIGSVAVLHGVNKERLTITEEIDVKVIGMVMSHLSVIAGKIYHQVICTPTCSGNHLSVNGVEY